MCHCTALLPHHCCCCKKELCWPGRQRWMPPSQCTSHCLDTGDLHFPSQILSQYMPWHLQERKSTENRQTSSIISKNMQSKFNWLCREYPSCLHTTPASLASHILSHTVPHCWLRHTSTFPSRSELPPRSCTSPSLQAKNFTKKSIGQARKHQVPLTSAHDGNIIAVATASGVRVIGAV